MPNKPLCANLECRRLASERLGGNSGPTNGHALRDFRLRSRKFESRTLPAENRASGCHTDPQTWKNGSNLGSGYRQRKSWMACQCDQTDRLFLLKHLAIYNNKNLSNIKKPCKSRFKVFPNTKLTL